MARYMWERVGDEIRLTDSGRILSTVSPSDSGWRAITPVQGSGDRYSDEWTSSMEIEAWVLGSLGIMKSQVGNSVADLTDLRMVEEAQEERDSNPDGDGFSLLSDKLDSLFSDLHEDLDNLVRAANPDVYSDIQRGREEARKREEALGRSELEDFLSKERDKFMGAFNKYRNALKSLNPGGGESKMFSEAVNDLIEKNGSVSVNDMDCLYREMVSIATKNLIREHF